MNSGPSTPGGSSSQNGGGSTKLYKTNKELLAYMSQAFNANRGDDFDERNSDDSSLDLDDDDDLSIGSSSSFSITSTATTDMKTVGDEARMLGDESGIVKRSKVAIFLGIVVLACSSALLTTYFVRKNENDTYNQRYVAFSEELSEKSQKALQQAFVATEQLSRIITDAMVLNNSSFVSLPFFEIYAGETKDAAKADVIFWTPRIAASQRREWESYTIAHQQWILDGLLYENSTIIDPGSISANLYTRQQSHHHEDEDDVHIHGHHFPIWQMAGAPRNASIVNLDLLGDSTRMEHDLVDATLLRQPLLSSIQDLQYLTKVAQDSTPYSIEEEEEWLIENNITIRISKYNPLAYLDQARQSYILQPIFANSDGYFFHNVAQTTRSGALQSDVVGFVIAVLSWESLFTDILPNGVHGMVAVVTDGCGTTVTYEVNGKTVDYLGLGDRHDPAFDSEVVNITDFGNVAHFSAVTTLHPEMNGTTFDERHAGTKKGHCEVRKRKNSYVVFRSNLCIGLIF